MLSIAGGLGVGGLGKLLFRRGMFPGDCWEVAFDRVRKKGSYVMLYAADGRKFKGMVESYTGGKNGKQLLIKKPKLILRDDKWNIVDEIDLGKEVLFGNESIREIAFL